MLGDARDRKGPTTALRLADRQVHEQMHAIKHGGAHLFHKVLWDHRDGSD